MKRSMQERFAAGNRQHVLRMIKKNWQLYLIILLPVIWLLVFKYGPMYGLQLAFKKYSIRDGIAGSDWVGMKHFIRFFGSTSFLQIMKNTLLLSFYQLLAGFPLPIMLALALNATRRSGMKKTVQFVTYMPYFISTVVLVGMLLQFTNARIGIFNIALDSLGFDKVDFMGTPSMFKSLYVWSGVWQNMGYGAIVYLAALSSIDQGVHEAALIDGANRFQRIVNIDLPGITPTVVTMLILNVGQVMNIGFEKVYLMQNDLNRNSSEIIATYIYRQSIASKAPKYDYSTAIGLFNSVINLVLLLTVNQISKKLSDTSIF